MATDPKNQTNIGLSENVASTLAYLFLWLSGIILVLVEKENKNVRFHAWQSIAVFVPLNIAWFIAGFIPVIGGILSWLISIATLVAWVFLMIQAFQGVRYKVPYVGEFAEGQAG